MEISSLNWMGGDGLNQKWENVGERTTWGLYLRVYVSNIFEKTTREGTDLPGVGGGVIELETLIFSKFQGTYNDY